MLTGSWMTNTGLFESSGTRSELRLCRRSPGGDGEEASSWQPRCPWCKAWEARKGLRGRQEMATSAPQQGPASWGAARERNGRGVAAG